jgi:DNA-binding beta-propeller fold protein YncE
MLGTIHREATFTTTREVNRAQCQKSRHTHVDGWIAIFKTISSSQHSSIKIFAVAWLVIGKHRECADENPLKSFWPTIVKSRAVSHPSFTIIDRESISDGDKLFILLFVAAFLFANASGTLVTAQDFNPGGAQPKDAPLRFVQSLAIPAPVKGNFDHFGIDLKRNRLFATAEDSKAVLVFDLAGGKLLQRIESIERPHAVWYREDTDRLYVTDGGDGSVKVYDANNYKLLDRIALLKDADSIGYDASKKYLYIDNGGRDVHQSYSTFSVIDTNSNKKIEDMKIDGDTLEAMALDAYRPRIYINDKANNEVIVVDRWKNTIVAKWPITLAKANVTMALDEQRQRLFVGCRDGKLMVLDSNTGKELQTLSITPGVDDTIYDPKSKRLYAIGGGVVDVYDQIGMDKYVSRGGVSTGSKARTGRFVPQLNRLFIAVPQEGTNNARVDIFEPTNTGSGEARGPEPQEVVNAPFAEELVLNMLSSHPYLRKMGLHVIPPGGSQMILIANGNATRLGIHTSSGDFAAVKDGKTCGPYIADGGFYNMKMPMFDANGRHIGILVMEIPATSASSEQDAAQQAEAIRKELSEKITSMDRLFQSQ